MTHLIVGLGNIGREYADTRHNIGFNVLDAWAQASNTSFTTLRYGAMAQVKHMGHVFWLLKPSTYMNLSGNAVAYWMKEERIPLERLLVISDDIALPFGTLRLRKQGSAGGHHGLEHIALRLGTNAFNRLRVGVGSDFPTGGQIDYVLGSWSAHEEKELPLICDRVIEAVKTFALMGVDRAMNICNTKKA